MNITKPGSRGCGDRKTGGAYLCLGASPFGTIQVEDLVRDPGIPWDKDWMSRAPTVLPRNNQFPKTSVHDVYMTVDSAAYPYFWPFMEEARMMGFSKRIPDSFSFDRLTVGHSKVRLIFPRGIPKFDYSIDINTNIDHHPSCKAYDVLRQAYPHIDQMYGFHRTGAEDDDTLREDMEDYKLAASFCTYAHQDLNAGACDYIAVRDGTDGHEIKAVFPSMDNPIVAWSAYHPILTYPTLDKIAEFMIDKDNWIPAILAEFTLSHVEIHNVDNPKIREKAQRAGYSVFVTNDEEAEEII